MQRVGGSAGGDSLLLTRDRDASICVVRLELRQPSLNHERSQPKRVNRVTGDSREGRRNELSP